MVKLVTHRFYILKAINDKFGAVMPETLVAGRI